MASRSMLREMEKVPHEKIDGVWVVAPWYFQQSWELYLETAKEDQISQVLHLCSEHSSDINMQWLYDRLLLEKVQRIIDNDT